MTWSGERAAGLGARPANTLAGRARPIRTTAPSGRGSKHFLVSVQNNMTGFGVILDITGFDNVGHD